MNAIVLFMLAAFTGGVVAAAQEAPVARAEVRKVALFKNGYNWVEMSATLPDASVVQLSGMPNMLLGTIWWDSSTGVVGLEGKEKECLVSIPNYSYPELLAANAGKNVKLTLNGGRQLTGKVLAPPTLKSPDGSFLASHAEGQEPAPRIATLQTAFGVSSVRGEDIAGVDVASGETLQLPTRKESVPVVDVRLSKPNPGAPFSFGYVSNGMSWLPEYNLELGKDGIATLTARADIINEMADLNDVQLQLVSGFPALGESLIDSPLDRSVKLNELLRKLGMLAWETRRESVNRMSYKSARATDTEGGVGSGGIAARTVQVEDLFYYTLPHFTCARGQSIIREIFTEQVPFSHIYTCTVPNQSILQNLSVPGEPVADVWHCVKLKNSGQQAWSTGIVTCTQEGNLVARSTLYFAAPNGESLLRLNKTLQADVRCSEELTAREERPQKVHSPRTSKKWGQSVQMISVYSGVLTFKNASDREMPMRVTKHVNGFVKAADEQAVVNVSPSYSGNPMSTIVWEFTLKPGESLNRTYTYEYEE